MIRIIIIILVLLFLAAYLYAASKCEENGAGELLLFFPFIIAEDLHKKLKTDLSESNTHSC